MLLTASTLSLYFFGTPNTTLGDTAPIVAESSSPSYSLPKQVIVDLKAGTLLLANGTTSSTLIPILTQGKPESYYETIGGRHLSDYKTRLHFSSIGHVYMPYSVHIFGNYFIHGVPYYPSGEEVSSAYSGGCIRLSTENAKLVYDFVERGTPIVLTRGSEFDFEKVPASSSASHVLKDSDMTRMMVAVISLETLTQDNDIEMGDVTTTRRKLLSQLLGEHDDRVAKLYAKSVGEEEFVHRMNQKAEALGLTNTHFNDVSSPVATIQEDHARFMTYIAVYKSYLLRLQ